MAWLSISPATRARASGGGGARGDSGGGAPPGWSERAAARSGVCESGGERRSAARRSGRRRAAGRRPCSGWRRRVRPPAGTLAKIAVHARENALRNPKAIFRDQPITIDDVLNSPLVVDPLRLLAIVMPCAGGAGVVVTTLERARRTGLRPVVVSGFGEHVTHKSITYAPSLTQIPIRAAGGMSHVIDAVKQIQGRAGPRQVAGCERGYVTGMGGGFMSEQVALVLEGA